MIEACAVATVEFGTSGYSADLLEVVFPTLTRNAIEVTTISDTSRKFIPSSKIDGGNLLMKVYHDPAQVNLIDYPEEEITVRYQNSNGTETYEKTYYGYAEQFGGESVKVDELMITNIVLRCKYDYVPEGQNTILGGWVIAITGFTWEFMADIARIEKPRQIEDFDTEGPYV
jgi:hypothetical protein